MKIYQQMPNKQLAKINHNRKESGRKGWKTYKETPTGRKQKVGKKKRKIRAHMNKPEHPKISLSHCFSLGPKMK